MDDSRIQVGNLTIDAERYCAWVNGVPITLTFIEFELLRALAASAGKVLSRQALLKAVWGIDVGGSDRRLNVHISRLRKKIADSQPYHIETVKKRGYCLTKVGAGEETPRLAPLLSPLT